MTSSNDIPTESEFDVTTSTSHRGRRRMGRDHHFSEHSRGHGRGRGRRQRARRGQVRLAVLTLLDERPMHGYELITELEDRSEGRWRPSPGSMYPALNHLEEGGIVSAEEVDGKKQYSLTDRGREVLEELRAQQEGDSAPWDDPGTGGRGDMRRQVSEIMSQARQIGRYGSAEQIEQAQSVLSDTITRLYGILADRKDDPTAD
jgi:DNA-binding PadR family transcriptional regulator